MGEKESKKILLTTMPTEGEFVNWTTPKFFTPNTVKYMPLGILSLATNLLEKHEIIILDPPSRGYNIEETIEEIEKENPDVLGLSVPTRRVYAMNEILKKTSSIYKVVGGPHATYYADQILKARADAVFVGSLADLEFKEAIEKEVKGIVRCSTKINEIKFPKRDFLDIEYYFPPSEGVLFQAENRMPMFSSIGCPNKCAFCNVQLKRIQYKKPQTVVDEMEYLYSIGCRSVHILDDNFNIRSSHLNGILDELEARGLNLEWSGRGQVKMNLNLVERLSFNNFKRIHVGIEALDDDVLRFLNKNQTIQDIEKFCEITNKNNIDILGYFILGSPVETDKYRSKLPERIRELRIKYPFFNILFPEPNTPYYTQLLNEGFYKKDHWGEYMRRPTPYFEIPYPYGEKRKQEVITYANELIENFKQEPEMDL